LQTETIAGWSESASPRRFVVIWIGRGCLQSETIATEGKKVSQDAAMKLGRIHKATERKPRSQLHKRMTWQTVWQVVGEFACTNMSADQALRLLAISRARLYQLRTRWLRMNQQGPSADWLYQRVKTGPSRLSPEVQSFLEDELTYIKDESEFFQGQFNFSFLAQRCHQRFGQRFHRNTLRRWAIQKGLFKPNLDSYGPPTRRFEMGAIGLLYQHDSSPHLWLPKTGRKDSMILTLDDHSRKAVGVRLVAHDTAWNHLCVVRQTIESTGTPLAYYTDHHQIFNPDTEINGQFARALRSVGVTPKLAPKARPQAKGKCENKFGYFQRRVPLLCEKYNVTSLIQANKILQEEVVGYYNECHVHEQTLEIPEKRWKKALEEGRSVLKDIPAQTDLDRIFALHYPRRVRNDGSISFGGQTFFLENVKPWTKVTVALRPPAHLRETQTQFTVLDQDRVLLHHVLSPRSQPTA